VRVASIPAARAIGAARMPPAQMQISQGRAARPATFRPADLVTVWLSISATP
jgi:hypothetical protein